MRHSREDYRFVVDLRSEEAEDLERLREAAQAEDFGIPHEEPVFLLRGQDACALVAVAAYVEAARAMGAHEVADKAEDQLEAMRQFQGNMPATARPMGRGKVPDLPAALQGHRPDLIVLDDPAEDDS